MNVIVIGRGKVGSAILARSRAPLSVRLVSARGALPRALDGADLIVLAARDTALPSLARRLRRRAKQPLRAAVIHVAGGLGPEVLASLAGRCAGVGRAHPLLSFADAKRGPELRGAVWLVEGDRVAVARARAFARALGGVPRAWKLDPARYHAAAALTANGAAALAGASARVLQAAGVPASEIAPALGALLRSVAENVARLGLPGALTGPVRRGDARAVARHLQALAVEDPEIAGLYRAAAVAQLALAEALGEASPRELRAVGRALGRARSSSPRVDSLAARRRRDSSRK